ncbi:molybdenum cofactor guanylyltransferase MobA [Stutzerimonas nitrititolerans]|uniref:molybdenum cofactor guanylyltransferase MobA n=1 Tax=Stutzerimonas nitrititolerans TaxID=2482751 RepID=UPI0028B0C334|nr:molybdenum cofactor guanylyltransferase MobA [Stutzerimonas nitrititolerans]
MIKTRLPSCSILLLAGGRGSRMGGQDKGLVIWRGQSLVSWLHAVARPLTDDLIISCNRNHQQYADFADQLVSDQERDFPGPLAGIRAGLAAARNQWLMVLPCDAPLIDRPLLTSLHEAAFRAPERPLMLRQGQQWQPLFCMIPLSIAPSIEMAWQNGARSNRDVLLRLGADSLELSPSDPRLANLNTPELLAQT